MTLVDKDLDLLRNFFSAYFHEDWSCEASDPEAVIDAYAIQACKEKRLEVHLAILKYMESFSSDRELESDLCSNLGCYYIPNLTGQSARDWLRMVSQRLTN